MDLLHIMKHYTPRLMINKVLWELPMDGWIKVNTDDASRENSGRSAIGFCSRDEHGMRNMHIERRYMRLRLLQFWRL